MSLTPITDMIFQMLSADVPHDVVARAARTAEIAIQEARTSIHPTQVDAAMERRRAWDRDRKARAKSGGIPVEPSSGAPPDKTVSTETVHRNSGGIPPETDRFLESKKEGKIVRRKKDSVGSTGIPPDEDFEKFWKGYPRTPTMSKKETRTAWGKLTETDREAVLIAGPKYSAWLARERERRPDTPAVHAVRFITQRRFDGFAEPPDPGSEQPGGVNGPRMRHGDVAPASSGRLEGFVFLENDTPEWDDWQRYNKSRGLKSSPAGRSGGWLFPTRRPPG